MDNKDCRIISVNDIAENLKNLKISRWRIYTKENEFYFTVMVRPKHIEKVLQVIRDNLVSGFVVMVIPLFFFDNIFRRKIIFNLVSGE